MPFQRFSCSRAAPGNVGRCCCRFGARFGHHIRAAQPVKPRIAELPSMGRRDPFQRRRPVAQVRGPMSGGYTGGPHRALIARRTTTSWFAVGTADVVGLRVIGVCLGIRFPKKWCRWGGDIHDAGTRATPFFELLSPHHERAAREPSVLREPARQLPVAPGRSAPARSDTYSPSPSREEAGTDLS